MVHIGKGRLEIYLNTDKLTAQQVRQKTGATVINGGVFDLSTWELYCHVKKDAEILASDPYDYWGYGWTGDAVPRLMSAHNAEDNYFCCCCMIRGGKPEKLIYNTDMGGARERTAIGVFPDGRIWMFAGKTAMTPERLQELSLTYGLDSAIMLDGGASTQFSGPEGDVVGGRKAAYYILLYDEQAKKKEEDKRMKIYLSPSSQPANTYAAGNTNEQAQCRRIAEFCRIALERCGFAVKVGDAAPDYTGRTTESNAWGADLHIPIHTNAASGTAHGPVVFVYAKTEARMKIAQPVYDALLALTPYKGSFGVQVGNQHETRYANGKTIYIEAAFHDNAAEAQWIIDHAEDIGEAICKGICTGTGTAYIKPVAAGDAAEKFGKAIGADVSNLDTPITKRQALELLRAYHLYAAPEDEKTVSGLLAD